MFYLLTAAAAHVYESSTTFVVAWSRALQWWQKLKVSFYIKIPPNWVTSLLKMLQSCAALQFSRRRFTLAVTSGTSTTGCCPDANTCCVVGEFALPPTIPTAVGRRADIRKFWWTLSFHLLSENRLWVVPDAEMLRFYAVASNFSRLRDNVVRQKCQRSCLHFCRCWTCRRQVDLGIFAMELFTVGLFVCCRRGTLWGFHTRELKCVAARPFQNSPLFFSVCPSSVSTCAHTGHFMQVLNFDSTTTQRANQMVDCQ